MIYFLIWYLLGIGTLLLSIFSNKIEDITVQDIFIILLGGLIGPVLTLWVILDKYGDKVIFKFRR